MSFKRLFKGFGAFAVFGMSLGIFSFGGGALAAGTDDAKNFTDPTQFEVDKDGTVTSYKGNATEVVIPDKLTTKEGVTVDVTGISGAFKDNKTVTNIVMPTTVRTLGNEAFSGCSSLNSIDVYNPIVTVDTTDFTEYTDYSGYVYDAASDSLYDVVDEGSNAVMPAALTTLGDKVFNECSFGGFYVIEGNTNFKDSDEIVYTDGDTEKKAGACLLSSDGKLLYKYANGYRPMDYKIPTGVEEIKPYAFYKVSNGNTQHVEISNTVKQIDEYGFYNNDILGINFEEKSVCESIGAYAFASCPNLDIKLPASVKTVKSYALAYIVNRTPDISETSIEVMEPYIFYGCTNLHTLSLPKTLKELEGYAFAGCDNLNEVKFLGETLDKIGTGAFQDCPNLHKINIPEGVKSIENDTFKGCQNLNEIILPDSLEKIGDGAFANCQNIHVLVIPENVKYISNTSFEGAKTDSIDTSKNSYVREKMNEFTVGKYTYVIQTYDKNTGTGTVYVKGVSKTKYKNLTKITIPATVKFNNNTYKVTSIKMKAFRGFKKLKKVTIGANVTSIGNNAFQNCTSLTYVKTRNGVQTIGSSAFRGCTKLKTVKLGKNVKKIYKNAFYGCKSLTKITVPSKVTLIGANAFYGCTKLKSVKLGAGLKEIGASAFKKCSALKSITIPAKVTKLGNNIFVGCKKLRTITIKSAKLTDKKVSNSAFKGVSKKAKIKVPKSKYKKYKKLLVKNGLNKKTKITK